MENRNPDHLLYEIICLFEGNFSIDWIVELSGKRPSEVLSELEIGVDQGWLTQTGAGQFMFVDQKKQQQIFSGIPFQKKNRLFRKVSGLLLQEYPGGGVETGKLARFLLNTVNDEARCRGLLSVGDAFVKEYQPNEAMRCYFKLKDDLLNLEGDSIDDLFIEMAIKYSKLSIARQSTTEVVKILEEAMERALGRKDHASQALIQMHIAKNEWMLNRYDKAIKMFNKGWALANSCNDEKVLRSAVSFRTYFLFWQGRFKDVIAYYENTISDVEKNPPGGFPLLVKTTVGQCYTYIGQITQGLGMLDTIQSSCIESGDMHTAAFATGSIDSAIAMIWSIDETLDYVKENYAKIQRSGNQYIELLTEGSLAYLYYRRGDITRSVAYLKKFVQKCHVVNIDTLHHTPYMLELCWAMEKGEYPRTMDLSLGQEVTKLISGSNVFLKGLAYRYRALLEMKMGKSRKTFMNSLWRSSKWLEESGHELGLMQTRLELVRQYLISNHQDNQVEALVRQITSVITQYDEDIIPPDLKAVIVKAPTRHSWLKEIFRFGREITTIADSKDLIQRIISYSNQLTGSERGAIFLLEETEGAPRLKLRASKNFTHEEMRHPSFASSMKAMEQVVGIESGALTENTEALITHEKMSSGSPVRSRVCIPIVFKSQTIGVLYHDNRLLNSAFDESDTELLSFFASQVTMVLENVDIRKENAYLKQKMNEEKQYEEVKQYPKRQFKNILGTSDAIQQMLFLVELVASTETNVLILGETGVGKDLVANAIHFHSARRDRPFIKANCSALTETLINSELFGHEQGAFTGADSRRVGRFELASGGTIFLDEIGDLPLSSQANILRVLQTREFERVGGNKTIRSDFRLIAATNRDLEQLVRENKFREDLFFRLNVFPIYVPPLRDRKEDIPLLVHHFIRKASLKLNKTASRISACEMKKLIQYHWPGNVREMENAIERAIIVSSTSAVKIPELDTRANFQEGTQQVHTLKENERNHILWALEQTNWKIRGAEGVAALLDIHPSTLAARMKKLNITRPPKETENQAVPG